MPSPSTISGIVDLIRLWTDSTALSDVQVIDLINDGQRRLQRESPFVFAQGVAQSTIATATGALQSFALPTDMKQPLSMYALISGEHKEVQYRNDFFELVAEYSGATSQKQPFWWAEFAGVGYFFPVLSSSITAEFYYEKLIPDFSGATASNDILERLPEVLKWGGTAEYYDSLGETQRSNTYRQKAIDALDALIKQQRLLREGASTATIKTPGTIYRRS